MSEAQPETVAGRALDGWIGVGLRWVDPLFPDRLGPVSVSIHDDILAIEAEARAAGAARYEAAPEAIKDELRRRRVGRTAAVQDELDELYFYVVGLAAAPLPEQGDGLDVERLERAVRALPIVGNGDTVFRSAVLALLAATPIAKGVDRPEAELDVERLTEALRRLTSLRHWGIYDTSYGASWVDRRRFAHEPGAEYTRLTPSRPAEEGRATHGRHCSCSACRREDWTNPDLAPCGMHGPECPRVYAPSRPAEQGGGLDE